MGTCKLKNHLGKVQNNATLAVIKCNSNEVDQEVKEEFYNVLQNTMKYRSKREIILLMGDFNANVGNDNTGYREIIGRHRDGDINENGQHLADVCARISYWRNLISSLRDPQNNIKISGQEKLQPN